MSLANLTVNDLAQQCSENTARFHQQQVHDSRFCYELLRRALREEQSEAFTYVYRIYETQVRRWVYRHNGFSQTGESAEYFVSLAFSSFYFAVRGSKFEKFPRLAPLLSYLKACVHTAIVGYLRGMTPIATVSLEDVQLAGPDPGLENRVNASQLWDHVCRVLVDDEDRFLARCVFVLAMKPIQVAERYPDRWETARQVSVALQRIRRALRRDPDLREWAGLKVPD